MKKFQIFMLGAAVMFAAASGVQGQVSSIDSNAADFSILSAGSRAAQIAKLRQVPSVGVINLAWGRNRIERGTGSTPGEFRISAEKNAQGINTLRRALARNPVTRAALAAHGVTITTVVGVDIGSDGSLRIFKLR